MIDLVHTKSWIQVCEVNKANELQFTQEYLEIAGCLGWGARKLAALLVTGWGSGYEKLLDYFGPDEVEEDWYTGIDGEPMDVCETIPNELEEKGVPFEGLGSEWHRDLYRAKLATLRLPKYLLEKYVSCAQELLKRK